MERDLFSVISDEHAQALVGGCDVCAPDQAAFVNDWHHLGAGHVSPQDDDFFDDVKNGGGGSGLDPTGNGLHNFAGNTAGRSDKNPT